MCREDTLCPLCVRVFVCVAQNSYGRSVTQLPRGRTLTSRNLQCPTRRSRSDDASFTHTGRRAGRRASGSDPSRRSVAWTRGGSRGDRRSHRRAVIAEPLSGPRPRGRGPERGSAMTARRWLRRSPRDPPRVHATLRLDGSEPLARLPARLPVCVKEASSDRDLRVGHCRFLEVNVRPRGS